MGEEKLTKRGPSTCIRFSENEHEQIQKDSRVTGQSIPSLLKKAYFNHRRAKVLMPKEEQQEWSRELRHWGASLRQLSERMNAGLMEGWYAEFQLIAQKLVAIENKILSVYGRR